MEIVDRSPDEYLDSIGDEKIRSQMRELDALVAGAMPARRRVLWEGVFWGGTQQSIVGYGDIVQPRPSGESVEWFLVGLARQRRHFSLYVNAVADGAYLGQQYADRLGRAKVGAASVTFSRVTGVDLDVLQEMLGRADQLTPPDRPRS